MKRILAVILLAVASLPASAQEGCAYISGFDQGKIVETGEGTALRYPPGYSAGGVEPAKCTLTWNDENANVIECDGYEPANFSLVPASLENMDELTILILDNGPWYRDCSAN